MRTKKGIFGVAAAVIICVIVVWSAATIHGDDRTYELRPEVRLPEYRTDAARAIDAYERLMDRYMGLTERSMSGMGTDLRDVSRKLDSMDRKLDNITARMGRIEKALGIRSQPEALAPVLRSDSPPRDAIPRVRRLRPQPETDADSPQRDSDARHSDDSARP